MSINPNTQYTLSGSQITDLRDYVQAAMESPSTLLGSTAPSSSTAADVGQLYLNTTNDKVYICTAKTSQGGTPETFTYTWDEMVGGATYTAGNGLNLSNNEFSIDTTVVPRITMSSTDPGEGSVLANNNYVAVYGVDPVVEDFSTTEINTGTKWVDGKTIYKRTVNFGALPNATSKGVSVSISNLDYIIKIEGTAYDPNAGTTICIPTASTTATASLDVWHQNGVIYVDTDANRSSYTTSYITLYYTKSS